MLFLYPQLFILFRIPLKRTIFSSILNLSILIGGHFMVNIIWSLLFSIIEFYAVDIHTKFYIAVIICIWILLLKQYSYKKNSNFYWEINIALASNFCVFLIYKYIQGYRILFDFEDWICIMYGALLVGNGYVLWHKRKNILSKEQETGKSLFRERKYDRDRLQEYLPNFPLVGINGPWGSGKSFVVDHLEMKDYILVKIDLLTCNLDEIQIVLLNELDKILKGNGIFSSFSPKLKKILNQGGVVQNIGQLFVRDDLTYSEAIAGFQEDLKKIHQTIIIVYEDLDRIDKPDVIKKVLNISEKIAGSNIRVIYQYDEKNLQNKAEFNKKYLEKYIPVTINLTDISFSRIMDYLIAAGGENNLPIQREDFKFLDLPIWPSFYITSKEFAPFTLQIPDVTIRKVEYFLKETILFMSKDGIYKKYKRETILFFLLKYFYNDIYMKLVPGKSLLETFLFSYNGNDDTLVNWFRYSKQKNINIMAIFNAEENYSSALMLSLFQYQCDIYESGQNLEDIVNEPVNNLQKQNTNEQKDRIVWNLLCNGKSEYTDQKIIIDQLQKEVLEKPPIQQKQAFTDFCDNIFHGRCSINEKDDNKTIFRVAVPSMISLFQASRVAGISGEQWIDFLRFYLKYQNIQCITPELIECLNYCDLKERKTYLFILKKFNKLEVSGNLNDHRSYSKFLYTYLSAFSDLGYVDTEEIYYFYNQETNTTLNVSTIKDSVFEPLKNKLEDLKKSIPLSQIETEINHLLEFLEKNSKLMEAKRNFDKPQIRLKTKIEHKLKNQEKIDSLNTISDKKELEKEVLNAYQNNEITAYEIRELYKLRKNKK